VRRSYSDRVAAFFDLVGLAPRGARPARRLSGGEQQRLALTRAPARDSEILFFNAPTANAPAKSFFDNPLTAHAQAFLNGDSSFEAAFLLATPSPPRRR
jgi:ABC-type thiamine transport system ATPase subunit